MASSGSAPAAIRSAYQLRSIASSTEYPPRADFHTRAGVRCRAFPGRVELFFVELQRLGVIGSESAALLKEPPQHGLLDGAQRRKLRFHLRFIVNLAPARSREQLVFEATFPG